MKFPKTAEDIEDEIVKSSMKQGYLRLRQFTNILSKVDDELIVEGVIKVFEKEGKAESSYREQEFAGIVLQELKPKSSKDLIDVILRTINNWDCSIEQLPFWFLENVARHKVIDVATS